MSKFVGVADSSHLARALLRNDDDGDDEREENKIQRSAHVRGVSIFHDIGKKDNHEEEAVFDTRLLTTPSPIQTSRRHRRQQSSVLISTPTIPSPIQTSSSQKHSRQQSNHLDDVLTSTLMTGEENFSKALYGDDGDSVASILVGSPPSNFSPPSHPPDLSVHVSLVEDDDEIKEIEVEEKSPSSPSSPSRVRGVSIFDDIDTEASEFHNGGDFKHNTVARRDEPPSSPSLWRRLREIGSHSS